jgi:hypothetical protein
MAGNHAAPVAKTHCKFYNLAAIQPPPSHPEAAYELCRALQLLLTQRSLSLKRRFAILRQGRGICFGGEWMRGADKRQGMVQTVSAAGAQAGQCRRPSQTASPQPAATQASAIPLPKHDPASRASNPTCISSPDQKKCTPACLHLPQL